MKASDFVVTEKRGLASGMVRISLTFGDGRKLALVLERAETTDTGLRRAVDTVLAQGRSLRRVPAGV